MNNRKRMRLRAYRKWPIIYVYTVLGMSNAEDGLLLPDFMIKHITDEIRKSKQPRSIKPISPIWLGRRNGRHDGYNVKFTTIDEVHMNHFERIIDFDWDTESFRKATEELKEFALSVEEAAEASAWLNMLE